MPTANSGSGFEFLRDHGARRAGGYGDAPDFFTAGPSPASDDTPDSEEPPARDRDYERGSALWQPISVVSAPPLRDRGLRPERFVDGKDVGRTVAYVLAPQGFPVPIRLSQIGAVALRAVADSTGTVTLRCESRRVEKVVSFMADLFPWDEVERLAAALHANGYRLLISRRLGPKDDPRNLAWINENARTRTREEMFRLERQAIRPTPSGGEDLTCVATIADGRLDDKEEVIKSGDVPVAGLIKSHANTTYLHEAGWETVYALCAGERTPVLALDTDKLSLITWYLRLCDGNGGPLDGIVRVEVPRPFFERFTGRDFTYIDSLSRFLCESRTRDASYSRAAVTLYPIQRAEDALRARFEAQDTLLSRFYHLTGL